MGCFKGFNCFKRRDSEDEGEDVTPPEEDLTHYKRINPVVKTYLYPKDITSGRRYLLLLTAFTGAFIWWLGPVLGLFLVDPMIQLMLLDASVITPATQCFDHRLANQTCNNDVMVDYYFWNITNADAWQAGSVPQYQEVGPYTFRAKEVRYNLQYDTNWTEVSYTYHQYAEFLPEESCPTCTMDAPLTLVNRAYLQFLASAGPTAQVDAESAVIYQLMPITLSVVENAMETAIQMADPASTTIAQDALMQWTDCSFLEPLAPVLGMAEPYLKDVPLPPGVSGFPFDPELCAYIPKAVYATTGMTITPANFAAYGLKFNYTAMQTFLALAIGQSNATYLDPAAAQFLGAFLTLPQNTTLAMLASISPEAAAALSVITSSQWMVLQGYLASLVPTWGEVVYSQFLSSGGGGLIVTKPISTWLYGFEDPLLTAAAQGASPNSYMLMPWTYTPSLALTFSSVDEPVQYFESVTGKPYNFSMLSWNSSDVGAFLPLIQQKKMITGKGQGSIPQNMLEYRGVPFFNKTWGAINVTGVNEGVAFGSNVDENRTVLTWDSVLSRPVNAAFSGYQSDIKKVNTLLFNMTHNSVAPCNWTNYGTWAGNAGFDPEAYHASLDSIPPEIYGYLMGNQTALADYLRASPLGHDLGYFYPESDPYLDRCATPEAFQAIWDMSSMLACPTIYTFAHFYDTDAAVVNTTGTALSTWVPTFNEHGYTLAVEPFTGYAIEGHKTYQVNHLVSPTVKRYPDLWAAPGSAAVAGLSKDFATVPVYWVRMYWEPTNGMALLIRIMTKLNDVFYYLLVVCWPVFGWLMLGPALFILRFGKDAKVRRKELPGLQRSRARPVRLTRHEKEMVQGLHRIARGSVNVILPEFVPEGQSEVSEADIEEGEGGYGEISPSPTVQRHRGMGKIHVMTSAGPDFPSGSSSGSSSQIKEAPLLARSGGSGQSSGGSVASEAPLLHQIQSFTVPTGSPSWHPKEEETQQQ